MINILKEIEIILRTHGSLSLKTLASHVPTILSRDTITNPYDTFNNYFASRAETTKKA